MDRRNLTTTTTDAIEDHQILTCNGDTIDKIARLLSKPPRVPVAATINTVVLQTPCDFAAGLVSSPASPLLSRKVQYAGTCAGIRHRRPPVRRQGRGSTHCRSGSPPAVCTHKRVSQCTARVPHCGATPVGVYVEQQGMSTTPTILPRKKQTSRDRRSIATPPLQSTRRSSSCPTRTLRGRGTTSAATTKSARQTHGQGVARRSPDTSSATTPRDVLILLLENAVDNLCGEITKFQQGLYAPQYTDGDLAAKNNHVHITRFFAKQFTRDAIGLAAARGHLEMVTYLHVNRNEGCTVDAMDLAATFGHLEVVRWLHTNRTEGCTTRAFDGAARNGHIDVSFSFISIYDEYR